MYADASVLRKTTMEPVTKPKKTSSVLPVVRYAEDLELCDHAHFPPIFINKTKGFRLVKVHSSRSNPHPLRIQFSNSSGSNTRIPAKFGVETNTHGKTYLTFPISCDKEYERMVKFQEEVKRIGKERKSEWWPYPVTDSQVEDNFANLVSNKKEKAEGPGFWPGNMKVSIPITDSGECTDCIVVGPDGDAIPITDVPGMSWDTVVVEVSGVYFQNRYNWGLGPKTLRFLRTSREGEVVDISPKNIDFSSIAMVKKSEIGTCAEVIEDTLSVPSNTVVVESVTEQDSAMPYNEPEAEPASTKRATTDDTEAPRKRRKKD